MIYFCFEKFLTAITFSVTADSYKNPIGRRNETNLSVANKPTFSFVFSVSLFCRL